MNNLKETFIKLKKQKQMLEKIINQNPQNEEQIKAIEDARKHLDKINNLLKIWKN